jgi:hypothetical protein
MMQASTSFHGCFIHNSITSCTWMSPLQLICSTPHYMVHCFFSTHPAIKALGEKLVWLANDSFTPECQHIQKNLVMVLDTINNILSQYPKSSLGQVITNKDEFTQNVECHGVQQVIGYLKDVVKGQCWCELLDNGILVYSSLMTSLTFIPPVQTFFGNQGLMIHHQIHHFWVNNCPPN